MTTNEMVIRWLGKDQSEANIERLARWMRDSLRVGPIADCRQIIRSAVKEG